tara:strand:+ start:3054 stop:3290 length:237 start_codon:yes stop_codon:yes gene_type:complete
MRRPLLTDTVRQKLLTTVAFVAKARKKLGPDQFTDKDLVDSMQWLLDLVNATSPKDRKQGEHNARKATVHREEAGAKE